jgi:hypothetical protein
MSMTMLVLFAVGTLDLSQLRPAGALEHSLLQVFDLEEHPLLCLPSEVSRPTYARA